MERYKDTGFKADYRGRKALKMINAEIARMNQAVKSSEKGSSVLVRDNRGDVKDRAYTQSTFPNWYRTIGAGSSDEFAKASKRKKGIVYKRIKAQAIENLEKGYDDKQHGFDFPDMKFKVASKQVFDNKDIIFRRVRGRIIPMRIKKKDRYDLMPEAPF